MQRLEGLGRQIDVLWRHRNPDADIRLERLKGLPLSGAGTLHDHEVDVGIFGVHSGDNSRDQARGQCPHSGSDAAAANDTATRILCALDRDGDASEDMPRRDETDVACRSEFHPARPTLEEIDTDLALEIMDLSRERGLRDAQLLGCAAEVELLGDRDEVADLAKVDVHR